MTLTSIIMNGLILIFASLFRRVGHAYDGTSSLYAGEVRRGVVIGDFDGQRDPKREHHNSGEEEQGEQKNHTKRRFPASRRLL